MCRNWWRPNRTFALIDFADFSQNKIAKVLPFERNKSCKKIRTLARVIHILKCVVTLDHHILSAATNHWRPQHQPIEEMTQVRLHVIRAGRWQLH